MEKSTEQGRGVGYQVRHVVYGVFQGLEMEGNEAAVCYHPAADCPEMGFYEFPTLKAAMNFVGWALKIPSLGYTTTDLVIEPFDDVTSDLLRNAGMHIITKNHWEKANE